MRLIGFLLAALGWGGYTAAAQALAVNNVKASQTGGIATVLYDLAGPAGSNYYVRLFYSTDGGNEFSEELNYVTGDVLNNVTPGLGKRITWNSNQEAGGLSGNVIFKVTAESKVKFPPPVKNDWVKIEVIDLTRNGSTAVVKIRVTAVKDIDSYEISGGGSTTFIIDNKGTKINMKGRLFFGTLLAGIPITKDITFEGVDYSASLIALLEIVHSRSYPFQFRNIPFPKE
jgi:hypothetical protein